MADKKSLVILQGLHYHYEIVESVIYYRDFITATPKEAIGDIYLEVTPNPQFVHYIQKKYPDLKINKRPESYDLFINCTVLECNLNYVLKYDPRTHFFICHRNGKGMNRPNVFFLTPLSSKTNMFYADKLPYMNIRKEKYLIPTFVIQGGIKLNNRNFDLLKKILDTPVKFPYQIKVLGRGTNELPFDTKKYGNRLTIKRDLPWDKFHMNFLDCYCILPLTSKKKNPIYYTVQLTSSINYARAYKLKALIDRDLYEIYKAGLTSVEVFENEDDICEHFVKVIRDFYRNATFIPNLNPRGHQWLAFRAHFTAIDKKLIRANRATVLKRTTESSTYTDNKLDVKGGAEMTLLGLYNRDYYVVRYKPSLRSKSQVEVLKKTVNLVYYDSQTVHGNFGDELSKFITEKLINKEKYNLVVNSANCKLNIICIGSYLQRARDNYYIFGTGLRTDPPQERLKHDYSHLNVCATRGPITRQFLEKRGIKCPDIYGDPGLLLRRFYEPKTLTCLADKIGLVPHMTNYHVYKNRNISPRFHIINPLNKWEIVVNEIFSCKCIISSSLHGLVVADAYGRPNVWITEYALMEGQLKFRDYFASQGRPIEAICNLDEFSSGKLYRGGNRIDLDLLIKSFPFT